MDSVSEKAFSFPLGKLLKIHSLPAQCSGLCKLLIIKFAKTNLKH